MVQIVLHNSDAAAEHRENVVKVWNETFGPVDDANVWRETVWDRHRARSGYRLATAYDDDHLVGFSWGYTGQPGQFWSDFILDKLGPAHGILPRTASGPASGDGPRRADRPMNHAQGAFHGTR